MSSITKPLFGGGQTKDIQQSTDRRGLAQFPGFAEQTVVPQYQAGLEAVMPGLISRFQSPGFQLGPTGLFPEQEQGFRTAVQQVLGGVSADYAQRGYLRPENIQAIAGSAAQNVMPGFLPLIGQNILSREQLPGARAGDIANLLAIITGGLGGQAQSTGQSYYPTFGSQFASGFGSALGSSLGGGGGGGGGGAG
jgi:hypothetical protein